MVKEGVTDFYIGTCKGAGARIARQFWSYLEFFPSGGPAAMGLQSWSQICPGQNEDPCPVIEKSMTQDWKNSSEKPFSCNRCSKRFKFEVAMKKHNAKYHSGENSEKSYVCPVCVEVFESHASKMEHIAEKHPETKIHDCEYCDFRLALPHF